MTSTGIRSLMVDLSTRYGGADSRVLGLLKALPPGSAALAGLDQSPVVREAMAQGFEVYTVGRLRTDPRIPFLLAKLIRHKGFHVMDAQNIQSQIWCSLAGMICDAALVSTLNSWYCSEHGGSIKGLIYQSLERLTRPVIRMHIAVSTQIRNTLFDQGLDSRRVYYIPNAFPVGPLHQNASPPPCNIPDKGILLCAVGRLVHAKGYSHLLHALPWINKNVHVAVAGDGPLEKFLVELARRLGVSDRICFTGFLTPNRVMDLMAAAHIFVMPSVSEGTPIALLEAAALAKPIVVTRVGGIPDILKNNIQAKLVEPADPKGLARAINSMIDHPEEASRMGRAAQAMVRDNFSPEVQVGLTLDAYATACRRSKSILPLTGLFHILLLVFCLITTCPATTPATESVGYSNSLPGNWRPFSDDSPFNTPIPEDAAVHPDSDQIIGLMAKKATHIRLAKKYSIPVWAVSEEHVRTTFLMSNKIFDRWDKDDNGISDIAIPLVRGMWPEPTNDGHICIIDRHRKTAWELSRYHGFDAKDPLTGLPRCTTFNVWNLNNRGVGNPFEGKKWFTRGGRGSGFPLIAGLVRPEELDWGEIRHALIFTYPHIKKDRSGKNIFVSPAVRSDGKTYGTFHPVMGMRLQLNPGLRPDDFKHMGLNRESRILARALQIYGMYLGDTGGAMALQAQLLGPGKQANRRQWELFFPNFYNNIKKIPTTLFRVIDTGPIVVR